MKKQWNKELEKKLKLKKKCTTGQIELVLKVSIEKNIFIFVF